MVCHDSSGIKTNKRSVRKRTADAGCPCMPRQGRLRLRVRCKSAGELTRTRRRARRTSRGSVANASQASGRQVAALVRSGDRQSRGWRIASAATPTPFLTVRSAAAMVCAHCGSAKHCTGCSNCTKYCTLCKQAGHQQRRSKCPSRECSK